MNKLTYLWSDFYGMFWRSTILTIKMPLYILISLINPLIWLMLFSQVFQSISQSPNFNIYGGSYLTFLAPGIVVMTTLFAAGWAGMGMLADFQTGVVEKIVATPSNRTAVILGKVAHTGVTTTVQCFIILGIACFMGAGGSLRVSTVAGIFVFSLIMSTGIAACSYTVAILAKQLHIFMSVVNIVLLPLNFMSSSLTPFQTLPKWVQNVSCLNPVEWLVKVVRTLWTEGWSTALIQPMILVVAFTAASVALCSIVFNRVLSNDWKKI
jgi:ABC-2 type transport system permease protein